MDPNADLSFEALVRRSIDVLRAHPFPLLLPPIILALLTGGGNGGGRNLKADDIMSPAGDPFSFLPFYALIAGFIAALLVILLVIVLIVLILIVVTALVWSATSRAILDHLSTGAAPDFGAAFRQVNGRWASLGWTFFLASVVVILGFIALVVPGVILLAGFLPLFAVLANEALGGPDALRRAWALSKGKKGRLAAIVLGGVLVNIVVGATLGWIPFIGWIVSGVVGGAVTAVWLVAGAIVYRAGTAAPPAPPAAPAAPTTW